MIICGIYKVTNRKNNKCYIGQSIDIYKRWEEHKKESKEKTGNIFHDALYSSLKDFDWEIIEEVSKGNLNEREKFWIQYYNSIYPNGYNMTPGGTGGCLEEKKKPVYQYDLEGNFLKEYESASEAGRQAGLDCSSISKACRKKKGCSGNFQWRYKEDMPNKDNITKYICEYDHNSIKVKQFDLDGNFIAIYNSISEAARALGIKKSSVSSINKVCKGKVNSAYNYQWRYDYDTKPVGKILKPSSNKKKKVGQYTLSDDLIKIYESGREASRQTGVAQASISGVCLGKQKTAGGYHWKYIKD